ncbi:GNAT family N-acetyltransferase [Xanthomonas euroxanthea]|nr:GNAT family N-acetyltransferase [Xanthomonas euroxanthea]
MEKTSRLAGPADIDAIFDIRTRVHENHFSRDQLVEMGITPATIQKAILETPCAWVAEVNGAPVGFSMADVGEGCVFAAFVLPDFEGNGLGRRLMDKAEACTNCKNHSPTPNHPHPHRPRKLVHRHR